VAIFPFPKPGTQQQNIPVSKNFVAIWPFIACRREFVRRLFCLLEYEAQERRSHRSDGARSATGIARLRDGAAAAGAGARSVAAALHLRLRRQSQHLLSVRHPPSPHTSSLSLSSNSSAWFCAISRSPIPRYNACSVS
jgi:hypothetical protein